MRINVPAKTLSVSVTSQSGVSLWPYDDGTGDPYWAGGATPRFYTWEVLISVTTQFHGSHLTRQPKAYNGLDIYVGDWIAGADSGVALKVITILDKTETSARIVIEDVLRYNTFRSSTGNGLFSVPGSALIFELNIDGDPIIDPSAPTVDSDFLTNLTSRMKAFHKEDVFLLTEPAGHSFSKGDLVSILSSQFVKTDENSWETFIGTVADIGPGSNDFLLTPNTRIVEKHNPALPGAKGDIIYSDETLSGSLTTTPTNKKAFIQMSDAMPSIVNGIVANPTTTLGYQLEINETIVTFSTGSGTIDDAIIDINAANTGVTASKVTISDTSLTLFYGTVLASTSPTPATATINGTSVIFNDDTLGQFEFAPGFANGHDLARSINNAGILNVESIFEDNKLKIFQTAGAALTIVNTGNDSNGAAFAGINSISGIPLSGTNTFLRLSRNDGGGIIVRDIAGTPISDFGLRSVENGTLPIGMVVEQGIRRGDTFVVATIAERNNISPVLLGDQAYVLDKGDGEWGLYLYDGSNWNLTSTQESANVDSDTISITINAVGSSGANLIKEINDGHRVTMVTVEVLIAFDGNPVLTVGDSGDNDRLMDNNQHDLSILGGVFQSTPNYHYQTGSDVDINAYFNPGTATVGSALVTITYS